MGWSLRETFGPFGGPTASADAATGIIAPAIGNNIVMPANAFLAGFDVDLSTVGTANMTVTVSNVPNGPYVYTVLTGQQRLIVTYPLPLQPAGGAPTITWTATAAAAGNITGYGELPTGSPFVAAIAEIMTGNELLGEASMAPGGADTKWLGPTGIHCPGGISINTVAGTFQGAVYASYYRELPWETQHRTLPHGDGSGSPGC
jgi:hypothetical protein